MTLRNSQSAKRSADIIWVNHNVISPMATAQGSDFLQDPPGAQSSEIDNRNSSEHPARGKHLIAPLLEHPIVAPLQNADYQVIVFSRELNDSVIRGRASISLESITDCNTRARRCRLDL
jgi:hypothetical protein